MNLASMDSIDESVDTPSDDSNVAFRSRLGLNISRVEDFRCKDGVSKQRLMNVRNKR